MQMPLGPWRGAQVAVACMNLRETVLADGGAVIYVRYLRVDGSDGGPQGGAQIAAILHPISDHLVIDKYAIDAFDNTKLHAYLRCLNAGTVILAGIATSHAVIATALTAVRHHYKVHVDPLTVTGVDSETHATALHRLRHTDGVTVAPLSVAI